MLFRSALQLNASKNWDADQWTYNLGYNGELFFYRDLTSRNYHVHTLTFGSIYQFYRDDDEPDAPDSSDIDEDSLAISKKVVPSPAPVHVDSLDRFLYFDAFALAQFDGPDFSLYDNEHFGGAATFRQPLGSSSSVRPSYMIADRRAHV